MKTMHKHRLVADNEIHKIKLSPEGIVREVEYIQQERAIYMWVEVPAGSVIESNLVERSFRVFLTGDGIPDHATYLGTALDVLAPEAYHVYELTE